MQLEAPAELWPRPQPVQVSDAPILNVLIAHGSTPLRSLFGFDPAATVSQYAAPASEYEPAPAHVMHPKTDEVPVVEYLPAGHAVHLSLVVKVVSQYLPGAQFKQCDAPAALYPLPQPLHSSVAPTLYVLAGHCSAPVRSAFAL